MRFKKILVLLLVVSLGLFVLSGCLSMEKNTPAEKESEPATNSQSESKAVVKLQMSHQMANTHSIHQTSLKFAELVQEKSNGTMEIEVFPSAALGTERENLEALQSGVLDMAIIAVEFYPSYVKEAGVFVLPFIYKDFDHQTAVLKGEAGERLKEIILDQTDVKVLSYYSLAFRQVFTTEKPVNTVNDIKGLKIRVPESPTYVNTFTMLGAAPTPVAWGETYTALETGVVQGLENTPESIYSASMHEVTKYMNITDHISAPTTFSISNKVFNKLTEEQQSILIEAAEEAADFGLELTIKNDTEFREKLNEELEIIETDKESMRNAIDYSKFDVMQLDTAKELKELIDSAK
jgi:tripartite ATP-independent transporter DctP family solute receptor